MVKKVGFNRNISEEEYYFLQGLSDEDIRNMEIDETFVFKPHKYDVPAIDSAKDDDFVILGDEKTSKKTRKTNRKSKKVQSKSKTKETSENNKLSNEENTESETIVKNDKTKQKKDEPHKNHRMRVRERFSKYGMDSFTKYQVLEMLLFYAIPRKDTNVLAHKLIDRFGTLQGVFDADFDDLIEVEGINSISASLIVFYRELYKYLHSNFDDEVDLSTSYKVGDFCCKYFYGHVEENLIVISMDANRKFKCVDVISRGSETETAYYPRKVMKAVVKSRANLVIVAHNHPGGALEPSANDLIITQKLANVLSDVGVGVVDHIICSGDKYFSFSERGVFKF